MRTKQLLMEFQKEYDTVGSVCDSHSGCRAGKEVDRRDSVGGPVATE